MAAPPAIDPISRRALPAFEWLAENAYIAPGKHRFLTAFGLMTGLAGGHAMMNVLTGQDWEGKAVTKQSLIPPLQPFHGLLAYNMHDDSVNAKWHKVADAFVPFICGAFGAMAGASAFSRGLKLIDEVQIGASPVHKALQKDLESGKFFLQHADMLSNREHSRLFNQLSGFGLNWGSTTGMQLAPNLFSASTNAFRFQLDQGKNIISPILRTLSGNRGHSSRNFFTALPDFIKWTENAAAHYKGAKWVDTASEALIEESSQITQYAKDMLQLFRQVTPAQQKLVEERIAEVCRQLDQVARETAKQQGVYGDELVKALDREGSTFRQVADQFATKGLEETFIDAGLIDPMNKAKTMDNLAMGDHGIISGLLKPFGIRSRVARHNELWWEALQKRQRGEALGDMSHLMPDDRPSLKVAGAAVAGVVGAGAIFGGVGKTHTSKPPLQGALSPEALAQLPRHRAARLVHAEHDRMEDHSGLSGFINHRPLDALHFLSTVTVVPPGMHRFMNAAFLSVGLLAGARFSCALAGRGLRGEHMAIDNPKIWPIFKPLYGKMAFKPASLETPDRWKRAIHQLIPVSFGAVGTYTGSRTYFGERIQQAEHAEYLEDYTDKVSIDESESYARATALTSVLNTGSGLHLVPFLGYPSHLQNRFLMAKGQQVATPLLGRWWSGNPSTYPYHVKMLLGRMISYAVENPDQFPRQFDDMAHALLAKLYPDLPPATLQEKEDALVDTLYEVRDKYWQPGGIPPDRQDECRAELETHFRRDGLERTLVAIGLNPINATIDNNGASGRFAKFMGASGRVARDVAEYREKAAARLRALQPVNDNLPQAPDTKIPSPAETVAMDAQRAKNAARQV